MPHSTQLTVSGRSPQEDHQWMKHNSETGGHTPRPAPYAPPSHTPPQSASPPPEGMGGLVTQCIYAEASFWCMVASSLRNVSMLRRNIMNSSGERGYSRICLAPWRPKMTGVPQHKSLTPPYSPCNITEHRNKRFSSRIMARTITFAASAGP